MTPNPLLWLTAFVWTLALELPIYGYLLRRRIERWPSLVALVLGINLATHPTLWYLYTRAMPLFPSYGAWLLVGELGVFLVEGALVTLALHVIPRARPSLGWAFLTSLAANTFSTLVGLVLERIFL